MHHMPSWNAPKNINKALEDGDGFWQDDRWAPLRLIAMSGTEFEGREIPVVWQIEFNPSDDDFEISNTRLHENGFEPDGYGWGQYIQGTIHKVNPTLAMRLHTTDCESDTCVIWVETVDDCRALLEFTWELVFRRGEAG